MPNSLILEFGVSVTFRDAPEVWWTVSCVKQKVRWVIIFNDNGEYESHDWGTTTEIIDMEVREACAVWPVIINVILCDVKNWQIYRGQFKTNIWLWEVNKDEIWF